MRLSIPNVSAEWGLTAALRTAQKFLPCQTNRVDDAVISLRVNDNTMSVRVPSFEMTYNTIVPVEGVEDKYEGEVLVNAKLLGKIMAEAHIGETISLLVDYDSGFMIASLGAARWQIPIIKTTTHGFLEAPPAAAVAVDHANLSNALKRVSGAVSLEGIRPYLRVVDCRSGRVRACDGTMYIHCDTGMQDLSFSIPVHILKIFQGYLDAQSEDMAFSESDFAYHFRGSNDYISFAKPAIDFPDLDSLLVRPLRAQIPAVLLVNRDNLVASLDKVGLLTNKDYGVIDLTLTQGELEIKCTKENGAQSLSTVPCQWGSAAREAKFNISDLRGILNSAKIDDSEVIELRFGNDTRDRKSPVVIEGEHTWAMLNQLR